MNEDLGCRLWTHSESRTNRDSSSLLSVDLLYRCDFCRTWWIGTQRYQNPCRRMPRDAFPEAL